MDKWTSPNPKFWCGACELKFSFSKIPGGLNINCFLWKFAWSKNFLLTVNNFFCVFKNTEQKNCCVPIDFKAKSEPKHKEKKVGGVSSKTKKRVFSRVNNNSFKNLNFIFYYACSLMKKEASCHVLLKNVKLCFENENFNAHVLARWNLGFGLLKTYLTIDYLTCSDRSKKIVQTPSNCTFLEPSILYCVIIEKMNDLKTFKEPLSWNVFFANMIFDWKVRMFSLLLTLMSYICFWKMYLYLINVSVQ